MLPQEVVHWILYCGIHQKHIDSEFFLQHLKLEHFVYFCLHRKLHMRLKLREARERNGVKEEHFSFSNWVYNLWVQSFLQEQNFTNCKGHKEINFSQSNNHQLMTRVEINIKVLTHWISCSCDSTWWEDDDLVDGCLLSEDIMSRSYTKKICSVSETRMT